MLLYHRGHRHDYCHDFRLTHSHKHHGLLDPQHLGLHIHRHLSWTHHSPKHGPSPDKSAEKRAEDEHKYTFVTGAEAVLGRFQASPICSATPASLSGYQTDAKELANDQLECVAGHWKIHHPEICYSLNYNIPNVE